MSDDKKTDDKKTDKDHKKPGGIILTPPPADVGVKTGN